LKTRERVQSERGLALGLLGGGSWGRRGGSGFLLEGVLEILDSFTHALGEFREFAAAKEQQGNAQNEN
jgi:hypothetical protein